MAAECPCKGAQVREGCSREGEGGGERSECSMRTEFQFRKMRRFWRCWWGWFQDSMNVLDATELCTHKWLRQ